MSPQQPDSLRAVLDSVFAAPAYRWAPHHDPVEPLRHAWARIEDWFALLHEHNPLAYRLVIYAMVLVMLAILLHAAWTFFRAVHEAPAVRAEGRPAFIPRDQAWYRAEADRLAAAGRYAEAIQADFLALVLALDARHLLRFHPSRTPGEYARDARLAPAAREEFRALVFRLYGYAFARTPCGAADFADWRARAAPDRYAPAN